MQHTPPKLFGQDASPFPDASTESLGSLQDYLTQRMAGKSAEEKAPATLTLPRKEVAEPFVAPGQQLNQVDTESAAAFEQHLPTPSIRLRVIRDRLRLAIQTMTEEIEKCEALQDLPPEAKQRIESLKVRKQLLLIQEDEIRQGLEQLYQKDSWLYECAKQIQAFFQQAQHQLEKGQAQLSPLDLLRRLNPSHQQLVGLTQQLKTLQALIQTRQEAMGTSPSEISQLISEFDHLLRQVDATAQKLQNTPSLWDRLNDGVVGLYQKLYA